MTVWTSSVVIEDDVLNTDADTGPFRSVTGNGAMPVPFEPALGDYPITTLGGSSGGTLAGQGGGINVF